MFCVVKMTLSAASFLCVLSHLSHWWAQLRTGGITRDFEHNLPLHAKELGWLVKIKSSIYIQTRPAKYRQLQCMLAPYNVLPVYFGNDRRGLDLGMRKHLNFHAWAAHLKLPAGIDPDGYSWCLSCEQYRRLLLEKIYFSYTRQGQGMNLWTRGGWVVILWPSIHSVDLSGMSSIELHKKHNYQQCKEW